MDTGEWLQPEPCCCVCPQAPRLQVSLLDGALYVFCNVEVARLVVAIWSAKETRLVRRVAVLPFCLCLYVLVAWYLFAVFQKHAIPAY